MTENLANQIDNFCSELKQTIKEYANYDSTKPAISTSNINLTINFQNLVSDISSHISPDLKMRQVTTEMIQYQTKEIVQLQETVHNLLSEIEKQNNLYNEAIDSEKKTFQNSVNAVISNYQNSVSDLSLSHDQEIKQLEDSIEEIKMNFDSNIEKEKNEIIQQETELNCTFQTFQGQFNTMKANYEKELENLNQQTERLASEINEKYGSYEDQVQEMKEQIEQKQIEYLEEMAQLSQENKEISESIEKVRNENQSKIEELQIKIKNKEKNCERKIQSALKAKLPQLENEINSLTNQFELNERELTSKLESLKKQRSNQTDSLQSELVKLKSEVNSCDSRIAKQLKSDRAKFDAKILAKESELKQFKSDGIKFIEMTRQAHQAELARLKNENENMIVILEQSLMKAVSNNEGTQRRIPNPRNKPKPVDNTGKTFQVVEPNPSSQSMQTPRRIKDTTIENVQIDPNISCSNSFESQFALKEKEARGKTNEFTIVKKKAENEARANRAKACAQLNELEKTVKSSEKELIDLKEQLRIEEEKHKEQSKEEEEEDDDESQKVPTKIDELRNSVEQQKAAIQQLKEEKDKLRVEIPKRKALQALHLKLRKDKSEIEEKIKIASAGVNDEIDKIATKMIKTHQEEQQKTNELLSEATIKLESLLMELVNAENEAEEVKMKDIEKWGQLRSGIADSTLSIDKKLNSGRPSSSTVLKGQSNLPPLKK